MNYDNNTYILRYFRKITYKERTKGRGPEGLTELPRRNLIVGSPLVYIEVFGKQQWDSDYNEK